MDTLWIFIGLYEVIVDIESIWPLEITIITFYLMLLQVVEFAEKHNLFNYPWAVIFMLEDEYCEEDWDDGIYEDPYYEF